MRIRIKQTSDADHRLSGGRSQRFLAGREYRVPRATGEALIASGAAVAVEPGDDKPSA